MSNTEKKFDELTKKMSEAGKDAMRNILEESGNPTAFLIELESHLNDSAETGTSKAIFPKEEKYLAGERPGKEL